MSEFEGSRYGKRTKKKKTNIILNSLIGLVLLLIIIVSFNIFFGNDESDSSAKENKIEKNVTTNEDKKDDQQSDSEEAAAVDENKDDAVAEDEADDSDLEDNEQESEEDKDAVVTEGGSDPNVVKTVENPSWKPVGTSQTGEHVTVYDGVDWDEMVKSISYATGLDQSNMTIYFLGNNGENKSVGTVSSKDKSEKYRVYIEWVDNEGWKPTKVEQLENVQ